MTPDREALRRAAEMDQGQIDQMFAEMEAAALVEAKTGAREEKAAALCILIALSESKSWREKHDALLAERDALQVRAEKAEARVSSLDKVVRKHAEGWANAIELRLIPPGHVATAKELRDEAFAALAQSNQTQEQETGR